MNRIKIIEIILLAASTLLRAAQAIIMFINHVSKLKQKPQKIFNT